MNSETLLSLLQFSDGLFPVGAYAHSFGLETYAGDGTIRDAEGVRSFLLSFLQGSVAPTDAVAALASRKAALSNENRRKEECKAIDQFLDAAKTATELRDASRQMGRQLLRVTANVLDEPVDLTGFTADLFRAVEEQEMPGHHAMAFGVVGAALGWQKSEVASAFLYSCCAGIVASALRLLSLGQLAGQRILWGLLPTIAMLASEVEDKSMADLWSFAPAIEIAAMRHANLEARLFRS